MNPIRVGCVKYLNTLPLIEGLQSWKDGEVVAAVPSRLIGMLRSGEVDVALASVIDAVGESKVTALSVGMIGCDGPTLTVRLFSRVPIEKISSVAIDTESHTSAVLMQVILARRYGLRAPALRVVDFDAHERVVVAASTNSTDAILLIGDKVVTDALPSDEYPHQLDLGQAWKEMTGLPFVYAVWMCRAGEERSERIRAVGEVLDRQRRHNRTRLDWVIASRAAERHWPTELAANYVGTLLKYSVGAAEREAVAKFIRWASELQLCADESVLWAEF